mgnify:FL=1
MDKKHKKKLKRAAKKRKEKSLAQEAQNKLKKQMGLFDRLPNSCSACSEPFPKTRDAHMSWQVVVRNEQETVSLFCPECQEKARKVLENNNEI